MEKGFTLKSIVIVLAGIILMASIAFFVQRNGEEPETKDIKETIIEKEDEIIEEEKEDEIIEEEKENEIIEEEKEDEIIEEEKEENIKDVDCGDANYLAIKAKKDLSEALKIDIGEIRIESCQEHFFSDYTLGTSGPGEVYPQKETMGYIIYLIFNEQLYRYHGSGNTLFYID